MSKRSKGEIPTKRLTALVFQGRRLAKLRRGGLGQIEADNPIRVRFINCSCCCSVLGGFGGGICRFRSVAILSWAHGEHIRLDDHIYHPLRKARAPNSKASVQPATIFFPAARGKSIDAHENVCLAQFDRFPAIDKRARRSTLSKVHGNGLHLGLIRVAQYDCAHYMGFNARERRGDIQRNGQRRRTNGEQEWTSGKGQLRSVQFGLEE
jgi:hypothetical protein